MLCSYRLPLLEIDLHLYGKDVVFVPQINSSNSGTSSVRAPGTTGESADFMVRPFLHTTIGEMQTRPNLLCLLRHPTLRTPRKDLIESFINAFFNVGTLFKRLDVGHGSYLKEIQENPTTQFMVAMINENFVVIEEEAMVFREQFQEYSYLWLTDLNASFEAFLETAWEEVLDDDGESTGRKRLALEAFDAEIKKYREKQTEIAELAHTSDVIALRINSQPIKQALSTWATKWIYLYTQYLQEHVEDRLNEIHSFIQGTFGSQNEDCYIGAIAKPKYAFD